MNWIKFLKHYNGWLGFVLGTILFFVVPSLYQMIDPTAGKFDAGYIHPIIYAATVVSFASGFAWLMIRLLAPGNFKLLDKWLEHEHPVMNEGIKYTLGIYIIFFVSIIIVVCAVI
jgi:hypothetical protein